MKKTSKTVVFFGNERLATGVTTSAPTLQALIEAGYTIAAVVSNYERGVSRSTRELEIIQVAEKHNIPMLLPKNPLDIQEQLSAYHADVGVLVAYGKIVPESIIKLFPHGIINIHPSLLPNHRGPTPIESAILEGADKTGVSIMSLAKAMDAGPVYGQSELTLDRAESKQALADQLLEIGQAMLLDLLPGILNGQIVALPQDHSRATYDSLLSKAAGIIDWSKPAVLLGREVRAFLGWPQSRSTIVGKDIIITNATPLDVAGQAGHFYANNGKLIAGCGTGALQIERLKPAGKHEMTGEAFLAGHKHLL